LDPAALGMLCALGSAVMWAVTSLLVRSLSPHFTSVGINALRTAVGGALLAAYVLLEGGVQPFLDVSPAAFTLMTLSVVAAFGVGDSLFFESTRTLGLGRAMTIATSYPVLAAVLAAAAAFQLSRPPAPPALQMASVKAQIRERLAPANTVEAVHCPATAERRPGTTFECAAVLAGGQRRWVTVTVLDHRGRLALNPHL
jgi:uncharacterized membrane protein